MGTFAILFPISEIARWEKCYTNPEQDVEPLAQGAVARQAGFLTRTQFLTIARWKSARPARHHARNDEASVREVTRFALGTTVEELRLKSLTLLHGVHVPTASTILHLCHHDRYPILDVRAFWSLGVEKMPRDLFAAWPEYVKVCRGLADAAGVDMRMLDRALWAYSYNKGQAASWV